MLCNSGWPRTQLWSSCWEYRHVPSHPSLYLSLLHQKHVFLILNYIPEILKVVIMIHYPLCCCLNIFSTISSILAFFPSTYFSLLVILSIGYFIWFIELFLTRSPFPHYVCLCWIIQVVDFLVQVLNWFCYSFVYLKPLWGSCHFKI